MRKEREAGRNTTDRLGKGDPACRTDRRKDGQVEAWKIHEETTGAGRMSFAFLETV